MAQTLVLGIGNSLLSDEGAGVHAITYLRQHYADTGDVDFMDGGTLSFTLAGAIEDSANLVVIDAAQLNDRPGTVQTFVNEDMDEFLGNNARRSVHEVSLIDLMSICRLCGALPQRRALIGIQPESLDWGEQPTAAVSEAIPGACGRVMQLVEEWRS